MGGMADFFTLEAAEAGIDLPLYLPSGEKTDFVIKIRGVDSEKFRIAEAQGKRRLIDVAKGDNEDERTRRLFDERVLLASALVISWNLPEPCTSKNIVELFKNAPQLLDMVDRIAGQRSLFFSKKQASSSDGLRPSSSSTKGRKARQRAPATT
jgi:hypothetical protein